MRGVNKHDLPARLDGRRRLERDWFVLDPQTIDSAPAAGADAASREYLFARRGADTLIYKEWNSTTGWGALDGLRARSRSRRRRHHRPGRRPRRRSRTAQVNLKTGVALHARQREAARQRLGQASPRARRKPRVTKIVFYTKGKGRRVRVDRKAPFEVHIEINRPAGSTGRVYARVYYKRSARGETHRKVVSRRYKVCR